MIAGNCQTQTELLLGLFGTVHLLNIDSDIMNDVKMDCSATDELLPRSGFIKNEILKNNGTHSTYLFKL